jgi:hypothetical protein
LRNIDLQPRRIEDLPPENRIDPAVLEPPADI